MRLYLAHSFEKRIESRELELEIEKETGIEINNPFYDCNLRVDDIKKLDKGESIKVPSAEWIVEHDLKHINACDGMLAFIYNFPEISNSSIGTSMEVFYCSYVLKRPVISFVFSNKLKDHPWINYFSKYVTTSKKDLIDYLRDMNNKYDGKVENSLDCIIS